MWGGGGGWEGGGRNALFPQVINISNLLTEIYYTKAANRFLVHH